MNIFENTIAFSKPDAARVGQWGESETLLRCPRGLRPFLAALIFFDRVEAWSGEAEAIENARQVVREFLAQQTQTEEDILTACPWYGANFRLTEEGMLEAEQGLNLVPPPWRFRLVALPGGGATLQFETDEGG